MELVEKLFHQELVELAWNFQVSSKSCDNPEYYNNYIRLSAIGDQQKGMGVTHTFVDIERNRIAGFVTLRATSLVSEGANGVKLVEPSLEIAELAVDAEYERCGIGSELIGIAIDTADELRKKYVGIRHLVVCADRSAIGFYKNKKIGFGELSELYEVLHDGWNDECDPLYITLPECTL